MVDDNTGSRLSIGNFTLDNGSDGTLPFARTLPAFDPGLPRLAAVPLPRLNVPALPDLSAGTSPALPGGWRSAAQAGRTIRDFVQPSPREALTLRAARDYPPPPLTDEEEDEDFYLPPLNFHLWTPALGSVQIAHYPGTHPQEAEAKLGEPEESYGQSLIHPDTEPTDIKFPYSTPPSGMIAHIAEFGEKNSLVRRIRDVAPRDRELPTFQFRANPGSKSLDLDPAVKTIIDRIADQYQVPRELADWIAQHESGGAQYNSDGSELKNPYSSATGIMQLTKATADSFNVNRLDPVQNIEGGIRSLAFNLRRFNGDVLQAAAAYVYPFDKSTFQFAKTGDEKTLLPVARELVGYLRARGVGGRVPIPQDWHYSAATAGHD